MIAFISGGARSGKSAVAESLALEWQRVRAGGLYYLATARVSDGEMGERIARHRHSRGPSWTTLEAPVDIAAALAQVESGSTLLLDCLTLWASQWLYDSALDETQGEAMMRALLEEARARGIALVIVSNDINEGQPPTDDETWRYLAFLQRIHRLVAKEADEVIQIVAGLAQTWKRAQ
ncbi:MULTISPECIES: bifunctional adenosylcobinamide kinase/adenosylcobinamide-phosphate guanylyltransferase [Halomonadaceae]|uniref:bifunctional adenosylcobinamide kinase/adenosylcobinamide-phosphate guanylyltransferase n=1 Tax=Halomonadaceae TaxID=28256 RepID=UPI00159B5B34|nr:MULTISPECIES: bifunctional adenosylcobinamide kinase/adenosylcobinamide-phosphate guanylyltransferase [Halomonas]QJQ94905.1 bifunctional adenosylcobinamide kinase/adenosylcobinamide-phosphate guanylyltransferase [Halomonas sp. PA5]